MRKEPTAGLYQGPDGEWLVRIGDGFAVPASGQFTVPGTSDFMYDVKIRFRWFEGRFDAVEVTVRGLEDFTVNGEVLRKVPIARLLREHLAKMVRGPSFPGQGADDEGHSVLWRPTRHQHFDDANELVRVATVYRIAYMAHEPPVQAVAQQLGLPVSTAGKKVIQARQAGLLLPTTPGKAGA